MAWSKIKNFSIVNFFGVVGGVGSIFLIPENTPVWIWCLAFCSVLAAINVAVWKRLRSPKFVDPNANAMLWIGLTLGAIAILLSHIIK